MIGILTFGVLAYRQLPVAQLPNVDFPTIQVTAGLPGRARRPWRLAVATPLEKEFSAIAGLEQMTSASAKGTSQITLQVLARPQHRCGRAGRADGDLRSRAATSARHADSAVLPSTRRINPCSAIRN